MHAQCAMLGKWKSARLQYQNDTNASLCPPYGLGELYFQLRLPSGVNAKGEMYAPIQSGHSGIKYERTVRFLSDWPLFACQRFCIRNDQSKVWGWAARQVNS
ncbi:hypothetical protein CEXT_230271 [Caerostris extrusa]|uniref:Uncharacterized protein n=1 Tax=Caerostris extrusa TaxID=172846 RepID=A0AAV4XHJ1_CAEEX|nr:hypothetical protein CEXT_230271 [Caerostris extrusa]